MKTHKSLFIRVMIVAIAALLCVGVFAVSAFAGTAEQLTITNFQTQMRDGGDFIVVEDLTATAYASVIVGNNVSLDLDTYRITVAHNAVFNTEKPEAVVMEIKGNGNIVGNGGNGYLFENFPEGSSITIKGGTFDISGLCQTATETVTVYVQGGSYKYDISSDTSAKVEFPLGYTVIYNDVTGYYDYSAIDYNISYDLDGGTNDASNPATYTVEDAVTLAAPTKLGYTFSGWVDAEGNAVTEIVAGSTGDVAVKATWTAIEYNIIYNLDGGTNAEENPATYTVEDAVTFAEPTKDGFTFLGWVDSANAPVTGIAAGTTGDVTVTATWAVVSYNITYDLDGGTNDASNPATYTVDDAITFAAPTKLGYTFGGWVDAEGNAVTGIAAGSTGDVTVKATWTAIEYNIIYNLDGGTNAEENPAKYTIEDAITFAAPTKTGYTFIGWVDSTNAPVTGIAAGTTGDITVTATYVINQYNLTIVERYADGTELSSTTVVLDYGAEYTYTVDLTGIGTNIKNGYVPDAWEKIITVPAEDTTVYITFYPLVVDLQLVDGGKIVVTYYDETVHEFDISGDYNQKIEEQKTELAAQKAALEAAAEKIANLEGQELGNKLSTVESEITALTDRLADAESELDAIQSELNDLKNKHDADIKDTQAIIAANFQTLLIICIILSVVTVGLVVCVVVIFVKRR